MLNAFETGERKVIPAVLVYVFLDDRVLMIHRNAGKTSDGQPDYHSGKWNGLGGKLELDESPLEAARREVREESALDLPQEAFKPLGVLQFPNFKPHKSEDWLVHIFRASVAGSAVAATCRKVCPEGELHWIPETDLLGLNLWPGDRLFLPLMVEGRPFIGTLWYQGEVVTRHWLTPLV